jgi:hypothetical protein
MRLYLIKKCFYVGFRAKILKVICLGNRKMFSIMSGLLTGKVWVCMVGAYCFYALTFYFPFTFMFKNSDINCWVPVNNDVHGMEMMYVLNLSQFVVCIFCFVSFLKTDCKKVVIEPHLLPSSIVRKIQD